MESIGEKLKKIREERGYTLDQVARDTHITKKFIQALEDEAFEEFPGESYLIGFLRNYANYLGLDEKETIYLYRNLRIQEQPAPISELLDHSRAQRIRRLIIALVIIGLFAAGAGIIYLTSRQEMGTTTERIPQSTPPQTTQSPLNTVQFTGDFIEQSLIPGTRISISQGSLAGVIDFVRFDNEQAEFTITGQSITMGILDSLLVDINGDGKNDIRLITKGTTTTNQDGLTVRIDRFIEQTEPIALPQPQSPQQADTQPLPLGQPQIPSRILPTRTITQLPQRQPFDVAITFTNTAMFRYLTDQGQTQEQYIQSGQTFQITVDQWIRFWISNAGAAQVRVAGVPVRLGANGEVHASLITWAEVPANQTQRIDLVPVY